MSSGFVSGGTTDTPIERDHEWLQAQQEIEATRRRKHEESQQADGKSLYEILQQNKTAKQEAFEESIRLKNQFRSLDEDEVEFLDSVLESTRAKEEAVKKETSEQLELFRRQREEAEKALLGDDANAPAESVTAGSPIEEESWATSKKRRRGKDKDTLLKGVKLRKTSSATEEKAPKPDPNEKKSQGPSLDEDSTVAKQSGKNIEPPSASTQPAPQKASALGLGDYSSDED